MAHDCTTLTRFDRYLPQLFLLLLQIIRLLPWSSRGCPPWITTSSCRTDNQNRLHLVSQKNKKKILYLFQGSHTLRRAILRSCRQGNVRNSICKYSCACARTHRCTQTGIVFFFLFTMKYSYFFPCQMLNQRTLFELFLRPKSAQNIFLVQRESSKTKKLCGSFVRLTH